jgi:hypothetical protein
MAPEEPGLRNWELAREYRKRAAEARRLSEEAPNENVRDRELKIEGHFLELAGAEEKIARKLRADHKNATKEE